MKWDKRFARRTQRGTGVVEKSLDRPVLEEHSRQRKRCAQMHKATERQSMFEETQDNTGERERHQMTKSLDSALQTWDFIP